MKSTWKTALFIDGNKDKLARDYPGTTMRFRSSTNAEDLDGFPCAGCYDSHTGDPADWDNNLLRAIRRTWATVWKFRTFEEARRAFWLPSGDPAILPRMKHLAGMRREPHRVPAGVRAPAAPEGTRAEEGGLARHARHGRG